MTIRSMEQLKKMGVTPENIYYTEGRKPEHVIKKTFSHLAKRNGKIKEIYNYSIVFKDMDCFGKGKYVEYYFE